MLPSVTVVRSGNYLMSTLFFHVYLFVGAIFLFPPAVCSVTLNGIEEQLAILSALTVRWVPVSECSTEDTAEVKTHSYMDQGAETQADECKEVSEDTAAGDDNDTLTDGKLQTQYVFVKKKEYKQRDISGCLLRNDHLTTFTRMLSIEYKNKDYFGSANVTSMTCTISALKTKAMSFHASIHVYGICSGHNYVKITDGKQLMIWNTTCRHGRIPSYFSSNRNNLTIEIHVGDIRKRYHISVSIGVSRATLDVVYLTATQGYIQTPGRNKGTSEYARLMDTWEQLCPLSDHVTLLSMQKMDVHKSTNCHCDDIVEVYAGSKARKDRVWGMCGTVPPVPEVLDTRLILVYFKTDWRNSKTGFKLLFSYHLKNQRPAHVPSGLWNCSVPEWPRFESHFRCNMEQECEGGEDEVMCYFSDHCGQGFLSLLNSCYTYGATQNKLSWNTASLICQTRGGCLANLNTPREWDAVMKAMNRRRRIDKSVFVGLTKASSTLPNIYKYTWQWADGSIAFYVKLHANAEASCGRISHRYHNKIFFGGGCSERIMSDYLCEFPSNHAANKENAGQGKPKSAIKLATVLTPLLPVPYIVCPAGHLSHAFLACDEKSTCWQKRPNFEDTVQSAGIPSTSSCTAPMTTLPAMFACSSGLQSVPYSMVCDYRHQCEDKSDEIFCVFPSCSESNQMKCVTSEQCISTVWLCDEYEHCVDRSDELDCADHGDVKRIETNHPPAVVRFIGEYYEDDTSFQFDPISRHQTEENTSSICPQTHFQCPGNGYCLPVYVRCNGVVDCPGREDEEGCNDVVCSGYYRCRSSPVCLHVDYICNKVPDCPEQDDELYCDFLYCPHSCTCYQLSLTCNSKFELGPRSDLRYIDAKDSGIAVSKLSRNTMLVHLSLANCQLTVLEDFPFRNLRILDLSDNLMNEISHNHFQRTENVQVLILSGNPLTHMFESDTNVSLSHLESLHLSRLALEEINLNSFIRFPNLLTLNLSHCNVRNLHMSNRGSLRKMRVLDLRHCHMAKIQRDLMMNLSDLETVFAEDYEMCCPVMLPPTFNPKNCHAPLGRMSSCDNLLSSSAYRFLFSLTSFFALFGNVVSIIFHVCFVKSSRSTPTDLFVTHLAIGDVAMGVCSAVVVVADRFYQGRYVLVDSVWRHSIPCKMVSFLFMLSVQGSLVMTLLVTFDRLLPLYSRFRCLSLKLISGHILCLASWIGSAILAVVSLLSIADLFGETAVCFPLLPWAIRSEKSATATFTVAVVCFNVLLMSMITGGQICIFLRIRKNRDSSTGTFHKLLPAMTADSSDMILARRVFSTCMLNVAFWLPLCVLAMLTWRGYSLPKELHVHASLIIPPINSAFRPFLYARAIRMESSRRERVEKLMAYITAQRRFRS